MKRFIKQPGISWLPMFKIFLSVLFFSCQKQIDQPTKENRLAEQAKKCIKVI